jgi:Pyridoxamine 5'-phosphate oxidase
MRWDAFAAACPEIAEGAVERFARDEVVLLGTLRRDGSPRISPCEPDVVAGHLLLGMMWRSRKVLDLERDPRVAVHSMVPDRESPEGDIKLYGRGVAIEDPGLRRAYREAIFRRIAWAPQEPHYHLYSIDVDSAGFTWFGDAPYALAWDGERGLRRRALAPPEV